ncbi:hypothetical protein [Glutamicibacter uratoxydans]|uniref:hypothetical protein n=1 Tax=Glutamicibacter uratoxydans TaxID=43667 RepID=UPI003D6EF07F
MSSASPAHLIQARRENHHLTTRQTKIPAVSRARFAKASNQAMFVYYQRMFRKFSGASIAALLLLLTGCGSTTTDETPIELDAPPAPKPTTSSASPEPTDRNLSIRGNLVKEMGEPAAYLDNSGDPTVKFRVDWIDTNPRCDYPDYPEPAPGRERIAVHLTVETTTALTTPPLNSGISFDPFLWKYIDASGKTWGGDLNDSSGIVCETAEGVLPTIFGPAEKGSGVIVMEVPSLDGILIYNSPEGFEFNLGKALKS